MSADWYPGMLVPNARRETKAAAPQDAGVA
jgi:hypothetical protein